MLAKTLPDWNIQATIVAKEDVISVLSSGEAQIAIIPMSQAPLELPPELVITAISKRHQVAELLLIRKEVAEKNKLLQLPENAIVACNSSLQMIQILDFKPDVSVVILDKNEGLIKLHNGDFDALVIDAFSVECSDINYSDFEVVQLNPKEFIPPSGQGFICFIVNKQNKSLRRLLQAIHFKPSVQPSNIERKFKKLFAEESTIQVGIYCEIDQNRYYHAWVVKVNTDKRTLHYAHKSSSTTNLFVEGLSKQF